jgi:hypothetical protein
MILNKGELRFAWIGLMSIASVTTSAVVVSFLDWIEMRSGGPDLLILTANSMMNSLSGANFGLEVGRSEWREASEAPLLNEGGGGTAAGAVLAEGVVVLPRGSLAVAARADGEYETMA